MELKELVEYAERAKSMKASIEIMEADLKESKAEYGELLRKTLPDLFQEQGISELALTSGAKIGLKQIFAVNMPAPGSVAKAKPEKRKELQKRVTACIAWLRKHKGADLVKSVITLEFSSGDDKQARAIFAELRKRKLKPSGVKSVHAGQLKAFLREKWTNDVEIPVELFETYTGQEAEVILPKPDKKAGK